MNMNKILKPKTKKQLVDDFIATHPMEYPKEDESGYRNSSRDNRYENYKRDLKRFAIGFSKPQRMATWSFAVFVWIFCLSWMIQAGISLQQKFFWFPIEPGTPSMLSFINIFWVILWFALPTAFIVYSITRVINAYNTNTD